MKVMDQQLQIRDLKEEDISAILDLQNEIITGLTDKEFLRNNSREMFESCILKPNIALGVFYEERLVALGIMHVQLSKEEDLSLLLQKHEVKKSANLKLVMVSKEFRGRGLQRKLSSMLEAQAKEMGITHLCATVDPDNIFSRRNLEETGYEFDSVHIKYGGLERNLYVKELR